MEEAGGGEITWSLADYPAQRQREISAGIRRVLESRGHDGAVVQFRPDEDRVLAQNFGHPQVVVFDQKAPAAPAAAPKPAPAPAVPPVGRTAAEGRQRRDEARQARARLGQADERAAIAQGEDRTSRVVMPDEAPSEVQGESGRKYPVRYGVAPLSEINYSHTFQGKPRPEFQAAGLQPRTERGSLAAVAKSQKTLRELNPEMLRESPMLGHGAPTVGRDLVVEGGHGRSGVIAEAYAKGEKQGRAYERMVRKWAKEKGVDIEGIQQPVLVRVREGDADRREVARETNVEGIMGQSMSERAGEDAERLGLRKLVLSPSEQRKAFIGMLGAGEGAGFVNDEGTLTQAGEQRLDAARFQAAFGDAEFTKMRRDDKAEGVKTTLNAAEQNAPLFAQARYQGAPPADLKHVTDALKSVIAWRRASQQDPDRTGSYTEWAQPAPDMLGPKDPRVADPMTARIGAALAGETQAQQARVLKALGQELVLRGKGEVEGEMVERAQVPLDQVAQETVRTTGDQSQLFRRKGMARVFGVVEGESATTMSPARRQTVLTELREAGRQAFGKGFRVAPRGEGHTESVFDPG